MDKQYIKEKENFQRKKIFVATLLVLITLVGFLTSFFITTQNNTLPSEETSLLSFLPQQLRSLTPIGLFVSGFFGGLFFLPIPQEVLFYLSLLNGQKPLLILLTINAGYLLAQIPNYYFGFKLYPFFSHFVSAKRIYQIRRFTNKYGPKGVFLANLLPMPAPLLTFALGITRYNSTRLFIWTTLGSFLKYSLVLLFFLVTN